MAGMLLKIGKSYNTNVMEFAVDTEDEINFLPTTKEKGKEMFSGIDYAPFGSTCVVGNKDGELILYMLFSFGWKKL